MENPNKFLKPEVPEKVVRCSYCTDLAALTVQCPECGKDHPLNVCGFHFKEGYSGQKCPQRKSGQGKFFEAKKYFQAALKQTKVDEELLNWFGEKQCTGANEFEFSFKGDYPVKFKNQEPFNATDLLAENEISFITPTVDVNYYGEPFHLAAALALQGYHSECVIPCITFSTSQDVKGYRKLARILYFFRVSLSQRAYVRVFRREYYRPRAVDPEHGEAFRLDFSPGKATTAVAEVCQRFGGAEVVRFLRRKWILFLNQGVKAEIQKYAVPILKRLSESQQTSFFVPLSTNNLDVRPLRRVLIVARQNKVKTHLNLSAVVLTQLVKLCHSCGYGVVHFGSRITGYQYPETSNALEVIDFIEHFTDPVFQTCDSYQRDLFFLDMLWKELKLIAAIGPKSGQIHGMCLIGLPLMDFEHKTDPARNRMFQWAEERKGFPGFARLLTTDYLRPPSEDRETAEFIEDEDEPEKINLSEGPLLSVEELQQISNYLNRCAEMDGNPCGLKLNE